MSQAQDRTPRPAASPNAVLFVILTSYFIIVFDLSIVYTGLPEIAETMALDPVSLSWVQNAYLLCFGGFLLLSSWLIDAFGRKQVFQIGIVLFTASSVVIGLAQAPWILISARAVQGMGASILAPAVLSIIQSTFAEGGSRTRALALYSMVAGFGSSVGLVIGGALAGMLSWRIGFLVNLPIGIWLLFAVRRVLAETPRRPGKIDLPGAATSTLGMFALVYGIVSSAAVGWTHPATLLPIGCAAILLTLFVLIEARVSAPIMPLRLFASPERSAAYASRMLLMGAVVSFFFFSTQFLQEVLGYSALLAGLSFLPMTIPTLLIALAVPRIAARIGQIWVLIIAIVLMGVGYFWLGQAGPGANFWTDIAVPMIILGVGNGAVLAPMTTFGLTSVEQRDQASASGVINVAHQLGGSLGLSLMVVVFAASAAPGLTGAELLSHRIGAALTGAAMLMLAALVLVIVFIAPHQPEFCRKRDTSVR